MSFNSSTMAFSLRSLVMFAIALVGLQGIGFAQSQLGGNRPAGASRMRVLEFQAVSTQPTSAERHHFAIVGAVHLPGVFYTSNRDRVSFAELLEAAEGRSRSAGRQVNIVRDGRSVAKSFDLEKGLHDEFVESNDIVIVVPDPTKASDGEHTIPIACKGLVDRPVVFPLSTEILTIRDLTDRLLQAEQAESSALVLDPHGRQQTRILLSGSVVTFNPRTIDSRVIQANRLLPTAVPINHLSLRSSDQEKPVAVSEPALEPQRPEPQPSIRATGVVEAVHESTDFHQTEKPIEAYYRKKNRLQQVSASELIAEATSEQSEKEEATVTLSPTESPRSRITMATPLPPLIEDAGESKRPKNSEKSPAGTAKSARLIGPWSVVLIVGCLAGACLWGAIVWSRIDRQRELISELHANDAETQAKNSAGNSTVKAILDQSMPMIEEEVIAPANIPLHGEPLESEPLAVEETQILRNSETSSATQNSDPEQFRDDSALDDSEDLANLEVVVESPKRLELSELIDAPASSSSVVQPVIPVDSLPEFDVVLPEPEAAEGKLSPLEKALRSIAKEDAA